MARSRSDIANSALRIFLQKVGRAYDKARGIEEYRSRKTQQEAILSFFHHTCCYCGVSLTLQSMCEDHLIPMNKKSLGLHAWGNIVPACKDCNARKHYRPWSSYLHDVCCGNQDLLVLRVDRIVAFLDYYRYDPKLKLQNIAENLYQDVGAVAMTLIDLRLKQAEQFITAVLARTRRAG